MAYPKFHKVEEWIDIHMRIDEWEFTILKEIKGPQHVLKLSTNIVKFLKRFVDFYLKEFDNSYIKVYGAHIAPLELPFHLINKMVFFQFIKQVFYFHKKFPRRRRKHPSKYLSNYYNILAIIGMK